MDRNIDVGVGSFFSNAVQFFIILTTALTLHRHGLTAPETSKDVALALKPLAGRFAALLYTIGLVGTGLLAIPTLAGSAAYAFAETFGWRQGIDENLRGAKKFYLVLALAIIVGMAINVANVNAVKALYWSAVLNGLLAPFLLLGILLVASDKQLMGKQPSSPLGLVTVGLTTIVMFAAAVGMFIV
jgi:Mn2+/Fe2+ NRAMP family transporter